MKLYVLGRVSLFLSNRRHLRRSNRIMFWIRTTFWHCAYLSRDGSPCDDLGPCQRGPFNEPDKMLDCSCPCAGCQRAKRWGR